MKSIITIAVIFGGRSQEHEASVGACAQIIEILKKEKKFHVVPIGITKKGEWYTGREVVASFQKGTTKGLHRAVLAPDTSRMLYVMDGTKIVKRIPLDVAFAWVLGPYGEDGTMQGLLEMADIPYVGSPVFASACGFNKVMTKIFVASLGILQVAYCAFDASEWKKDQKKIITDIKKSIGFPCFVKPVSCGSSVGVSKVKKADELSAAIRVAFTFDTSVLVEAGVRDARELECAVLGNEKLLVSVPGQVEYEGEFYDYHAKYLSQKWNALIPPPLPKKTIEEVRTLATKVFKALGAAGGARVDFLVDGKTKKVYFNEINTLPSFRSVSMFTALLEHAGISYRDAILKLIDLALERHRAAAQRKTDFSSGTKWF